MQDLTTMNSAVSQLTPAHPEILRSAIVKLFAAYPAYGSAEATESAIGTYAAMLKEYPIKAITDAAQAFMAGKVKGYNPANRPSVAQWAVEACNRRDAMRAEFMPRRALPAPEVSQNQDLTTDQIAARSKLVDDWRVSLSREAPEGSAIKGLVPATKPVLTDEEKADIISELSAAKDRPLTISHRFATLLQEQIAEGDEARQRRAFSASHQNELTP
jgi:hypothetical protein